MLKIRIEFSNNVLGFICPSCGMNDVAYIRTPQYCWKCGISYSFDINSLIADVNSRYNYYSGENNDV